MSDLNSRPLDGVYAELASGGLVRRVLELARDEDLGSAGDVTSEACIPETAQGTGAIIARATGVVAGLATLPELVQVFGGRVQARVLTRDGAAVEGGVEIATVTG